MMYRQMRVFTPGCHTCAAATLQDHAAKAGVSDKNTWEAHKALMLAMAMQECSHMDIHQRDFTKDKNPDKSGNCTIFNLSVVSEPVHTIPHRNCGDGVWGTL